MFVSASASSLQQASLALQTIVRAVSFDEEGHYDKAVPLYRKGIAVLRKSLPQAPEKCREELENKIAEYESRLMVIEPLDALDLAIPPEPSSHIRPYWLMKTLEGTCSQGAFLTSSRSVFVPKSVWSQSGIKITGLQLKIDTCTLLSDMFQQLSLMDVAETDPASLAKELDNAIIQLIMVQNRLAMSLSFIHEIPEPKKQQDAVQSSRLSMKLQAIGHLVQKQASRMQTSLMATRLQQDTNYVDVVSRLFTSCQFLVNWAKFFDVNPDPNLEVQPRIERISSFLHDCVCHFVMDDFASMLLRHLETRRKAFLQGDP